MYEANFIKTYWRNELRYKRFMSIKSEYLSIFKDSELNFEKFHDFVKTYCYRVIAR